MPAIPTAIRPVDPEPELERPPAQPKRERETYGPDGYDAFARRALRGLGKRAATGDLDALTALENLKGYVEEVMATIAVPGLRSEDGGRYSNREIGQALGYSDGCARQAVHNRFPGNGARRPGGQPANLR